MKSEFVFVCPVCRSALNVVEAGRLVCPVDGCVYRRVDGIWRFLRPDRELLFAQFIHEYETVRRVEGRGSTEAAYYRSLPCRDLTGQRQTDWQIRARSFTMLVQQVIISMERVTNRPLRILDLGAGNGWLSYQLARRGHRLAAVDLGVNPVDGLGTHIYYDVTFTPIQAEFDYLPFRDGEADLAVFNASLHYTPAYETTLRESLRVINKGKIVIVDTPVYHDAASGAQMVREREVDFQRRYGFASNAIASENYLTYSRLASLAQSLGVHWQLLWPVPRWRWTIRRWRTRWRGQREPAQFPIVVGEQAHR